MCVVSVSDVSWPRTAAGIGCFCVSGGGGGGCCLKCLNNNHGLYQCGKCSFVCAYIRFVN